MKVKALAGRGGVGSEQMGKVFHVERFVLANMYVQLYTYIS